MMGHPAERRLIGFLDGSLADGRRRAVAGHLADCQRCRDIVQAHRLTRLALTGDPAAPPMAILGRVLATRASGGGVILPVDVEREPRKSPFTLRYLKLGAIGAALVAVVVALTRVPFPDLMPQRGFNGFGATLQEVWSRALEAENYNGPPRLMLRPDAPAAVPDPSRMRELTATYERREFRSGKLSYLDSSYVVRIRRAGNDWQVTERSNYRRSPSSTVARLDGRTLELLALTSVSRRQFDRRDTTRIQINTSDLVLLNDTTALLRSTEGRTYNPPGIVPRAYRDSVIEYAVPRTSSGLMSFWSKGIRVARMTATPLARRWIGSWDELGFTGRDPVLRNRAVREVNSRRVIGVENLTVPFGTAPAWKVESWDRAWVSGEIEYYRQSDGLLIAELSGDPGNYEYYSDLRLLSVTYP